MPDEPSKEEEVENTSMRDALEAAFEEPAEDSTPTPQELLDASAEEEIAVPTEEEVPAIDAEATPAEEEEVPAEEVPAEEGDLKAPPSWSATDREEWGKVPPGLQATILKRERDFSVGIQKYAEGAKFGQKVVDTLQPYRAIMAAEGADELAAIKNLAEHAAVMRMGTRPQKAHRMAELIQIYDIDIEMLDDLLSGQGVSEEDSNVERIINERMAPVNQLLQRINEGQQLGAQRTQQEITTEIGEFEKTAEFLPDVREVMADLLELKAKRGESMTLQAAYDQAVSMNPGIQKIVAGRKRQADLKSGKAKIAAKTEAASSIDGGGLTPTTSAAAPTVRGAIVDAWNEQSAEV